MKTSDLIIITVIVAVVGWFWYKTSTEKQSIVSSSDVQSAASYGNSASGIIQSVGQAITGIY